MILQTQQIFLSENQTLRLMSLLVVKLCELSAESALNNATGFIDYVVRLGVKLKTRSGSSETRE